jgi:hypothetical protein
MFSSINWSVAWAPWILLALDEIRRGPGAKAAAILGAVTACGLLSGGPAGFWYSLLVAVPYGAWVLVDAWRGEGGSAHHARRVGLYVLAAFGLFLVLVAGQWLVSAELLANSVRANRDLGFIGTTAFGADDLFGFLVPRMPGGSSYLSYVGVFGAAAIVSLRPTGRRAILAAICLLGVLLAWGSEGPFLPLLASSFSRSASSVARIATCSSP